MVLLSSFMPASKYDLDGIHIPTTGSSSFGCQASVVIQVLVSSEEVQGPSPKAKLSSDPETDGSVQMTQELWPPVNIMITNFILAYENCSWENPCSHNHHGNYSYFGVKGEDPISTEFTDILTPHKCISIYQPDPVTLHLLHTPLFFSYCKYKVWIKVSTCTFLFVKTKQLCPWSSQCGMSTYLGGSVYSCNSGILSQVNLHRYICSTQVQSRTLQRLC